MDGNCEPTEAERPYVERLRALDEQIEASGGWKPEAPPGPEPQETEMDFGRARRKVRKRASR
jgi:hypothetical protein